MKKRFGTCLLAAAAALALSVSACGQNAQGEKLSQVMSEVQADAGATESAAVENASGTPDSAAGNAESQGAAESNAAAENSAQTPADGSAASAGTGSTGAGAAMARSASQSTLGYPAELDGRFKLTDVPAYSGTPYAAVNGNVPFFTEADLTEAAASYEQYSALDSLGRCGFAVASVGQDIMPTEDRGAIGQVKPTGWKTVKYDNVDGKYLYNRCHLIGYQLTAENANEKNLITGTRYLNVDGMLPFENMTADYVKETGNHVLYRVTPVFEGNNLVASGVLMEAESVEDKGAGLLFCVYVYNVQPGISINYATGDSTQGDGGSASAAVGAQNAAGNAGGAPQAILPQGNGAAEGTSAQTGVTETYVLNTNSKKFHRPDCKSVAKMSEKNKKEFTGTREALIAEGYEPCRICNP